MKEILSKFVIGGLIASSLFTTGAVAMRSDSANAKTGAVGEIEDADDNSSLPDSEEIMSDEADEEEAAPLPALAPKTGQASQAAAAPLAVLQNSTAPNPAPAAATPVANGFTAATLALHNKPGDCYIAHNGTVYDVSSRPEWQGCTHHGATGGIDITPFFPHPISYLASVPKVGVYAEGSGGATASGASSSGSSGAALSAPTSVSNKKYEEEDEYEYEREDEDESEDFEDD